MSHREDEGEEDVFDLYYSTGNVRDDPPEREDTSQADPRSNSEDDNLDDLELSDLLIQARKVLLVDLLRLVKAGQATPPEKTVLAKLLKDNGIVLGDPFDDEPNRRGANGSRTGAPQQERAPLPTFEPPEYT